MLRSLYSNGKAGRQIQNGMNWGSASLGLTFGVHEMVNKPFPLQNQPLYLCTKSLDAFESNKTIK